MGSARARPRRECSSGIGDWDSRFLAWEKDCVMNRPEPWVFSGLCDRRCRKGAEQRGGDDGDALVQATFLVRSRGYFFYPAMRWGVDGRGERGGEVGGYR